MKKFSLLIAETAAKDFSEIIHYRINDLSSPNSAESLIKKVRTEISRLMELPFLYPLVSDEILAAKGIRKLNIENLLVFYTVSEEERSITIIRILYARRDWINLL